MTGERLSINTILISFLTVMTYLSIGNVGFLQSSLGQAEETFGQNSTFLEEVEEMRRQTQSESLAGQNHTSAASSPIPQLLSERQSERPTVTPSSNVLGEPEARIIISGQNTYIVWETNETGDWEVMLRASNDNGETFGEKINLSNSSKTDSENAELAAVGNKVYVVWHEIAPDPESVLRISNDSGHTFGPIMKLSDNGSIGEKKNYLTYENSTYGIQLKYPSEWQVTIGEEDDDNNVIDIVGFHSPLEYRLDKYKEKVWISIDNLRSENITLKEYATGVIDYNNQSSRSFRLLDNDTDSMILAGYPAYRLIYNSTIDNGTNIKQMEIGTKIGDKVYYIDYYAEGAKYDKFLPIVQDMINSLKIEGSKRN